MGKLVLEIEEFAKTYSEYKSFDQDCIRIGRAYNNDLIINDPFVGASHFTLKSIDGAWVCENNDSLNGTFISSLQQGAQKAKIAEAYPIASGDTIFIGKTTIHVWDINHPIATQQPLEGRSSLWFDPRKTTENLVFNFAAFGFVYYLFLSLSSWRKDDSFLQGIAATSVMLFCLVLWSALWAFITRFTKRQHRFLQHLIFSLQWAVMGVAISYLLKYIFFFVCNDGVSYAVSLAAFSGFFMFILNNHLNIATNLSVIKRTTISGAIALSMIFLSVLGFYATHNEFSPEPRHYVNIVPVPKILIPSISINEENKRLDSIF